MKKKIKILYDGSRLDALAKKESDRSGIFFVVYNVLRQFIKRDDVDVEIFLNSWCYRDISRAIREDSYLKNVKCVNEYSGIDSLKLYFEYLKRKNKEKKESKIKRVFIKLILNLLKFLSKMCKKHYRDLSSYDVYFMGTVSLLPEYISKSSLKKVVILYDTIPVLFPQNFYGGLDKTHPYFKYLDEMDKYSYYFSISESAKNDFIKCSKKINPNNITTTYISTAQEFEPKNDLKKIETCKEKYNIPKDKKYIFSLCSIEPRKNLLRAVKSYIEFIDKNNIDDLVYVLGGGHWGEFIEKLDNEIQNLGKYKNKIIKAGYVDDEDLPYLYSGSEFFVYTSEYEGFGMPPLEAMQCGKAVITSNNSSLPEVVGSSAIMINFDSQEEHIKAYETLYFDKEKRKEFEIKGIEQAKKFSWKKTTDIMIEKIKELV